MSGLYDSFQIGDRIAIKLIDLDDPVTILQNLDITDTVWLGTDSGVNAGFGYGSIPLQAGGSVSLDGSVCETWGICSASQAAALIKLPGGLNYAQGAAAIAAQIAASGLSSSVPTQISAPTLAGAAGNSFGPLPFTFPLGAAYELILTPSNPVNACISDILVEHIDASNNVLYSDQYTVGLGSVGNFSPVIVRGNLQSKFIRVSGRVATTAEINALPMGTGPFTATGLVMAVYSQAFALNPATPKIVPSNTTSGILAGFQATSLGAGLSSISVPVFSYQGAVNWDAFGATAGIARGAIQFFRVANGASPQGVFRIQNDGIVSKWEEITLPGYFATFSVTNQ